MAFAKEMLEAQRYLEDHGHVCVVPESVEAYASGGIAPVGGSEGASRKIARDLIRGYFRKIQESDAVLVLNYSRNGIENYVGGNSFLEMGFAHVLGKLIFLLHAVPETPSVREEIEAMQPVILHGELQPLLTYEAVRVRAKESKPSLS